MQGIVCKKCGSNELKKKREFYECLYCHTKYTEDQIHGIISGRIKLDRSDELENCLELAEFQLKQGDVKEANVYLDIALRISTASPAAWSLKMQASFIELNQLVDALKGTGIVPHWKDKLLAFQNRSSNLITEAMSSGLKSVELSAEDYEEPQALFTYKTWLTHAQRYITDAQELTVKDTYTGRQLIMLAALLRDAIPFEYPGGELSAESEQTLLVYDEYARTIRGQRDVVIARVNKTGEEVFTQGIQPSFLGVREQYHAQNAAPLPPPDPPVPWYKKPIVGSIATAVLFVGVIVLMFLRALYD